MKPGPQFGPLYHGSAASFEPGDKVLPPNVAKAGTPNSSHPGVMHRSGTDIDPYQNASATSNERQAWYFAGMTAGKTGGRAAVYRVAAPTDARKGEEPKEVLSKQGFPVLEREDIRPPETVRKPGPNMRYHPNPNGRQGTLPIDWTPPGRHFLSQYGLDHGDMYNHPTEYARKHAERRAAEIEAGPQFKHPPMYLGGYKVDDSVSEAHQSNQQKGPKQPMLPGMRGAVKRGRKA